MRERQRRVPLPTEKASLENGEAFFVLGASATGKFDAKARWRGGRKGMGDDGGACLSESGFSGLTRFSGFRFVHFALFAVNANYGKANWDEGLPIKDELVES